MYCNEMNPQCLKSTGENKLIMSPRNIYWYMLTPMLSEWELTHLYFEDMINYCEMIPECYNLLSVSRSKSPNGATPKDRPSPDSVRKGILKASPPLQPLIPPQFVPIEPSSPLSVASPTSDSAAPLATEASPAANGREAEDVVCDLLQEDVMAEVNARIDAHMAAVAAAEEGAATEAADEELSQLQGGGEGPEADIADPSEQKQEDGEEQKETKVDAESKEEGEKFEEEELKKSQEVQQAIIDADDDDDDDDDDDGIPDLDPIDED
jgi:hypothetical protein